MEIRVISESDLSEIERKQMDEVCHQAFKVNEAQEGEPDYTWTESSDWHVLVEQDGRFVSHVGILDRTCLVGGDPVRLGGIGGVATLPELWHRGLGSVAMKKAAEFMLSDMKVDFGLLLCAPETARFYRGLGWQAVVGPLHFDQPGGKVTDFPGVTMILPCVKQDWPMGIIDMCGLPW